MKTYQERYLEHYGVKGMRWGHRKDGAPQGTPGWRWGVRRDKRKARLTRVAKGKGSRLDKVRVGVTQTSALELVQGRGFKNAANLRLSKLNEAEHRALMKDARIRDVWRLSKSTSVLDILPSRRTTTSMHLDRSRSREDRAKIGRSAAASTLAITGGAFVAQQILAKKKL